MTTPTKTTDSTEDRPDGKDEAVLVSLVVPVLNEAPVLEDNLAGICAYMETLAERYPWELIIVNDGSLDETAAVAERFAATRSNVQVLHHRINFGLGQALRYALSHCHGAYVVTLDVDLSYSPDHIERLLRKITETGAKVVVASPYTEGGKISAVPWLRRTLSVWANRFLALAAQGNLSTLTGMVRAYDTKFLRRLNSRAMGMDVNPEIIFKSMLLQGRIEEIPAHLDWGPQQATAGSRSSSMRMFRQTTSVFLSGFLFRPVIFFILPGLCFLAVAAYSASWVLIHIGQHFATGTQATWIMSRLSAATAAAFQQSPHSFLVAGMSLTIAIQLVSLGILSLQSRSYFEEIFYLGSNLLGLSQDRSARDVGVKPCEPTPTPQQTDDSPGI